MVFGHHTNLQQGLYGGATSFDVSDSGRKYSTPHVLMDDIASIGFHSFKKSIRFLFVNTPDLKVTGLRLKLFFRVKILVSFINFSKF